MSNKKYRIGCCRTAIQYDPLLKTSKICYYTIAEVSNFKGPIEYINEGYNIKDLIDIDLHCYERVYFYDAKVELRYIVKELLRRGWVGGSDCYELNKHPGQGFGCLIGEKGDFYLLKIKWADGHICSCYDLRAKTLCSMKDINKDLKLINSDELDYDQVQQVTDLNKLDIEKVQDFAVMMAKTAQFLHADQHTSLTIGTDALKKGLNKALNKDEEVREIYPVIDQDIETNLRKAYRGGLNLIPTRRSGMEFGKGLIVDFNQLYPAVLSSIPMPWGLPHEFEAYDYDYIDKEGKFFIYQVELCAHLKEGCFPCISTVEGNMHFCSDSCARNGYMSDLPEGLYWLSQYDLYLLNKYYNHEYEPVIQGGYWFDTELGRFSSFIQKNYEQKLKYEGGKKIVAKLTNNNLVGKFGSKSHSGLVPVWRGGKLSYIKTPEREPDFSYVPLAICVTSAARSIMADFYHKYKTRIIGSDTDNMILKGWETVDVEIGPDLGKFKVEAKFTRIKFLGFKCYAYTKINDDNSVIDIFKVSGMCERANDRLTWDQFKHEQVIEEGRSYMKEYTGGPVRVYTSYTLPRA